VGKGGTFEEENAWELSTLATLGQRSLCHRQLQCIT